MVMLFVMLQMENDVVNNTGLADFLGKSQIPGGYWQGMLPRIVSACANVVKSKIGVH
jgi:hypothetical protein